MEARRRALIVGAGPGGLTAAITLRRSGIEPVVYERASEPRRAGSGLTLWPNAAKALEVLGIAGVVRSVGLILTGIEMRSSGGELLFSITPNEPLESFFGGYSVTVHRAELLAKLRKMLGINTVYLGPRCTGFRQDKSGVVALFEDGTEAHGDILIGADGIKSVIRTQLFGESVLEYAGYTVWRGIAEFQLERNIGLTSLGCGAQFGFFPMTRQRVYWFASANAPEGERDWTLGRKRELLERFGDWHEPVKTLIETTNESCILRNDIYDCKPLNHWSDGRVTLLGDAAHPTTPSLGQGACQAIEDAVVLAKCLHEDQDIASALRAYESRRVRRANTIALQSRRIGQMGQWENSAACWLRNKSIKSIPERARVNQLKRMFRF